jgi:hypothetical protein
MRVFFFSSAIIALLSVSGWGADGAASVPANAATMKTDTAAAADTSAQRRFSRLSIIATPPDADISLDSAARGQGPIVADSLQPGQHIIIVKAKGYFGKKVVVDVSADTSMEVSVVLVRQAHIVVISEPPGATVSLDGKEIGTTPAENAKVMPGSHAVKIVLQGFDACEKQVTVAEGVSDTLSVKLQPVSAVREAGKKPQPQPKKIKFDRPAAIIAACVFVVFGIVIIGLEAAR